MPKGSFRYPLPAFHQQRRLFCTERSLSASILSTLQMSSTREKYFLLLFSELVVRGRSGLLGGVKVEEDGALDGEGVGAP